MTSSLHKQAYAVQFISIIDIDIFKRSKKNKLESHITRMNRAQFWVTIRLEDFLLLTDFENLKIIDLKLAAITSVSNKKRLKF